MKHRTDKKAATVSPEPPACRIISDAIDEFRENRSQFKLDKFVSQYPASSPESKEAFMDEIKNALRLEEVFSQFRSLPYVKAVLNQHGKIVFKSKERHD